MTATVAEALRDAQHALENWSDPGCKVALRELVAALTTPLADDVREALAELVADGQAHPSFPRPARVAPFERDFRVADSIIDRFEVRPRGTVTDDEALAKAWDDGVRTAGAYGHEDTWTRDMTPYSQNPYRGELRS